MEAGETAGPLRARAALAEDTGSVPAPTWWVITVCTPVPGESNALFRPLWALHAHGPHTHMQAEQSYS